MAKAKYVDGFILAVPRKNLALYKKIATKCGKIWLDHGAVSYVECVADDVKKGKITSFPRSVLLKPGEVVVFSWATYKSRKDRDRANKAIMKDPRMKEMMDMKNMPFDGQRMIYGGFEPFVNL